MCRQLQPKKTKVVAVNIKAQGIYPPYITNKMECISFKSACHMGSKTFKRRLLLTVALTIMALPLLTI